jgi:hypothetical protein
MWLRAKRRLGAIQIHCDNGEVNAATYLAYFLLTCIKIVCISIRVANWKELLNEAKDFHYM